VKGEPSAPRWLVGGETQEGVQPYWGFHDLADARAYGLWCAEVPGPTVVVIDVETRATVDAFEFSGRAA
jgi:hypothetical protein